MSLTVHAEIDVELGPGLTQSVKLPAIQLTRDATVKSVSPAGEIAYDTVFNTPVLSQETNTDPQIAALIKPAFANLKGFSGSASISDRGESKDSASKPGGGSDPQMQILDSVTRFAVPLPEEPIGPGARWEVKTPIRSQGLSMDITTTYELVSLDGDRAKFKRTFEQHAANQKVQVPNMPGGAVEIAKMVGKGTDDISFDLNHVLPTEATSAMVWDVAAQVSIGGQKTPINLKATINSSLSPK
jgi:hypothetical protein